MAFTRKISQQLAVPGSASLPDDMPRLPEEIRARFKSAADYERNMAEWWLQTRRGLQRQQEETASELTKRFTTFTTSADQQALADRLAALENTVANLPAPTTPETVTDLDGGGP
jgi:hypothetical protein